MLEKPTRRTASRLPLSGLINRTSPALPALAPFSAVATKSRAPQHNAVARADTPIRQAAGRAPRNPQRPCGRADYRPTHSARPASQRGRLRLPQRPAGRTERPNRRVLARAPGRYHDSAVPIGILSSEVDRENSSSFDSTIYRYESR